jgi:hypothetical protein
MWSGLKFTVVLLVLSGCVTSSPQFQPGDEIHEGHGVVVTAIHSNWKGYDNFLLAKPEFYYGPKGDHRQTGKPA